MFFVANTANLQTVMTINASLQFNCMQHVSTVRVENVKGNKIKRIRCAFAARPQFRNLLM